MSGQLKPARKKQRKKPILLGEEALSKATPDNVVSVFQTKVRYIYQGLPTRPARYLLCGLRRPVVPELIRGLRGLRVVDKLPGHMAMLGLMKVIPHIEGRRTTAYMTSQKGLDVLKGWSARNRDFHGYYQAYCPYDIDNRLAILDVDLAIGVRR